MVGVSPARWDARKSDGGMNKKERERSESFNLLTFRANFY